MNEYIEQVREGGPGFGHFACTGDKCTPAIADARTPQPGPENSNLVVKANNFSTITAEMIDFLNSHPEWQALSRHYGFPTFATG